MEIPAGVQREIDAAEQRTGWTRALDRAAQRLRAVFRMSPEQFEEYSARLYDNLT